MSPVANLTLRAATEADNQVIRDLLERSGLPTRDLGTAGPEFVIASIGEQVIGVGALERFGGVALLRSVAVENERRGSGVGRLIVGELERRARSTGVTELILLTLTARDFFEGLGYRKQARRQVPAAMRECSEFLSVCPASAVCMSKNVVTG